MSALNAFVLTTAVLALAGAGVLLRELGKRGLTLSLASSLLKAALRRGPRAGKPIHVFLCIADHYEPQWGRPDPAQARNRVERWVTEYPRLFGEFRDSDGRAPRHTFFFPIDEYDAEHVDALRVLCRAGFGEVEVHLHHDQDTSEALRERLIAFRDLFANRHGALSHHRRSGRPAYGFIHGNWALDNSRHDGRCCGVNNELDILRETGCYADFTLPSAPDPSQTRKINSIYYAIDDPGRPKSHDTGVDVGTGPAPPNGLMLIQGPLLLDWSRRKWGIVPRIENSCLQANQAPTMARLDLWLKARVQVPTRPDWFFVKLHTHGAPESNQRVLLGEPMVEFHRALAKRAGNDASFQYHYVTAREMYNLAKAAESGWKGPVAEALDYELIRHETVRRNVGSDSAVEVGPSACTI